MKNFRNIIYGIILIGLGIIFGLNALGYTQIDIFFDGWWTLFIIIPCFIELIKGNNIGGNIGGVGIGVLLLLICQDVIEAATVWKLIIPIVLVLLGIRLIFKDAFGGKTAQRIKELNYDDQPRENCYASFSSQKINFNNKPFTGADLTSAFGSIACDLTFAQITDDCVINASVTFGTIDVLLPQSGINLVVKSTSIFGGVSQKRGFAQNPSFPTVYVNATCLFGGVDLK